MNFKILLALAFLPLSLCARQYNSAFIPDSLKENAHDVIREERQRIEVKSDKEGVLYYRQAVTLLNSKSDANKFVVHYDGDTKVKKIKAYIYDAYGNEVRKVDKDQIEDWAAVGGSTLYSDSRVKYLNVEYNEYPYTIEFEYEQELSGRSFAFFPNWAIQSFHQSIVQSDFIVEMPADISLHYQMLNSPLEPRIESDEQTTTYGWSARHLKAVSEEPYSPGSYYLLPRLITGISRFQIDQYTGSMANWESYSAFIYELHEDREALPDYIAKEVHTLTKGLDNDKDKIAALYRYMQQNLRYVSVQLGIGGWQPFSPEYVAENKYGDCKALSNFMRCMLKEAGITSYPALVYGGTAYYDVQPDFAFPAFNHEILYIPSEDTWLECTSNLAPPGYLGSFTAGRNTLLIKPSGGVLHPTPVLKASKNLSSSHSTVRLSADGNADILSTFTAENSQQRYFRYYGLQASAEEQKEWWQKQLSFPAIEMEKLNIDVSMEEPLAALTYSGKVHHYGSQAGKRLFIPLNAGYSEKDVPKAMEERLHPVQIKDGYTHIDTTTIHLPKDYRIESMSKDPVFLASPFGTYEATFHREESRVMFVRRFQLKAVERPAAEYKILRDFLVQVSKADQSMVVLVEKKT